MSVAQAFDLAVQHHQAGRLAEAEAIYRQILNVEPNHADAWHMLGVIANQTGRRDLSVEWIRKAITLDPNNAEAHYNLGNALKDMGQLDEAIAAHRAALLLRPDYAEAHNNLGDLLCQRGQLEEAIAACRRARELKPDLVPAHYNLGNALKDRGDLEEAVAAYRRGLDLDPNLAQLHNNLGVALHALGRHDQAIAAFHRAIQLRPAFAEAENNLGAALLRQGRLDEAEAAIRRALEITPAFPHACNNLGNVHKERGQLVEAIAAYRRAIELTTGHSGLHSSLLFTLHSVPGLDKPAIAAEHQRWNRLFAEIRRAPFRPYANDGSPERRLRIGYVSPDFLDHVVGRNLSPLFRCHDRESFEIFCYAEVARPDTCTEKFRHWSHHWRSTVGMSDDALAERIREDGIDILVDLAQHTAGNRLAVFARKPAPLQVSFAGYPESTGLDEIEYRISDRWLVSEIADRSSEIGSAPRPAFRTPHSALRTPERVFLLDSFWCYDPDEMEIAVNELPAIKRGHATFGSLNTFSKINDPVLHLWARVLGQVKASRLILLSRPGSHRQRTRDFFEREGIAGDRVEFLDRRPRRAYLELYHGLDIALDPFPYGGHTSSLDALWMGVPVVSLAGQVPVSRGGLSILSNLGLPEFVAHSEDEYVSIAAGLARDLPRLADLRATLRARMESSVLMDAPRFARRIEAAWRGIWREWCAKTGEA